MTAEERGKKSLKLIRDFVFETQKMNSVSNSGSSSISLSTPVPEKNLANFIIRLGEMNNPKKGETIEEAKKEAEEHSPSAKQNEDIELSLGLD